MGGGILDALGLGGPDRFDKFLDEAGKALETVFVDLPKESWKEIKRAGRWSFSGPNPEVPPDNEVLKVWNKVYPGENPTVIDIGTDSKDKKYFEVVAKLYEDKRREIDDIIKPIEDWLRRLEEDNKAIVAQLEATEESYTALVQEEAHIERMNLDEIQQLEDAEDKDYPEPDLDSYGAGAENYDTKTQIAVKEPGLSDAAKSSICDPDNPKRCLNVIEKELAGVEATLDSLKKNVITIDRVKVAEIKVLFPKLGELLEKRLSAAGTVELPVVYIMLTLQKLLKDPQERRAKYEKNRNRARKQVALCNGNLKDREK